MPIAAEVNSAYILSSTGSYLLVTQLSDTHATCQEFGTGKVYRISRSGFASVCTLAKDVDIETMRKALPVIKAARVPASRKSVTAALKLAADFRNEEDEAEESSDKESTTLDKKADGKTNENVGKLYQPTERDGFHRLVLHPKCVKSVLAAVRGVFNREAINSRFALDQINPMRQRCAINLYGVSGTGKSAIARAVAQTLDKPLFQLDYASIISKWLGDTGKHIRTAFDEARKANALLFIDEADALLTRRTESGSSSSHMNQGRIIFMQELDSFDGAVITTTNLFTQFDPALLRRFSKHIHVELPDAGMRQRIFDLHLPKRDFVDITAWSDLITLSEGMSGGDIFTAVINGIEYATSIDENPENWWLRDEHLKQAIKDVQASKLDHQSFEPADE